MKKPLILVTSSNLMVGDLNVVRLNHEYVNAVVKAGGVPMIVGNPFGLDELIEVCDGLLLTGGVDVDPALFGQEILNDSVHIDQDRDTLELQLIEKYWKTGKPALAICRGLQVLNVAFGGTLIQDIPTWCGATHTAGAEHPVDVVKGSLLQQLTGDDRLMVNSLDRLRRHHDRGLRAARLPAAGRPVAPGAGLPEPGGPHLYGPPVPLARGKGQGITRHKAKRDRQRGPSFRMSAVDQTSKYPLSTSRVFFTPSLWLRS